MSEREKEDIYKRGYRHGRKDAIEVACRWYNYGWYLHSVNNGRSAWYRLMHNVKRWTLIEEN